jgi:hypothetical protein
MKSPVLTPILFLILGTLTACGGDSPKPADTLAPIITLNGNAVIVHNIGEAYTDVGATATDAIDGDVVVTTSDTVLSDEIGSYTITYTATDAAASGDLSEGRLFLNLLGGKRKSWRKRPKSKRKSES